MSLFKVTDENIVVKRGFDLDSASEDDVEVARKLSDKHVMTLSNVETSQEIFLAARQLHDHIRRLNESAKSRKYLIPAEAKRHTNGILTHLEAIMQRETTQPDAIKRLVVGNKTVVPFLHRTDIDLANGVVKAGLRHNGDITSTATVQLKDEKQALVSYRDRHQSSNAVVVMHLPGELWHGLRTAARAREEFDAPIAEDKRISAALTYDANNPNHEFAVHSHHMVGHFDQTTNPHTFHLNPRYENYRI